MKLVRMLQISLVAGLLCVGFNSRASADEWNKETTVTISETLEIPGHVLPPGTYVFKLAEHPSYRHIVQVWTGDKTHLIATVFAVPVYRDEVSDDAYFQLDERPGDSPQAIRAWFYPGEHFGNEFSYPRSEFRTYSANSNTTR
ncbi:MAG: hypothetical protein WB780_23990 [Candidatus Acidiferrales bacterium]